MKAEMEIIRFSADVIVTSGIKSGGDNTEPDWGETIIGGLTDLANTLG